MSESKSKCELVKAVAMLGGNKEHGSSACFLGGSISPLLLAVETFSPCVSFLIDRIHGNCSSVKQL